MNALTRIQDRVRDAASKSEALRIVGGDSKQGLGREPVGSPVDVSDLAGVIEYQPTELMITVRAGTTISHLQDVLADNEQILASESADYGGKSTVGGTLACNQSGPSRPWHGSIRDHVLGIRLINGKAEHLRFGGQVMKNVAGYDVSRLQAGAMGTFGILTEVSLKVLPQPEASATVCRELDADSAIRVMNDICTRPTPLSAACWYGGTLFLRLSGPESVVEASATTIGGERVEDAEEIWSGLREHTLPFFETAENLWRFSLRPNAPHFASHGDWLIDWGGAQRWLAGQYDPDELDAFAAQSGGEVSGVRGGDRESEVLPSPVGVKRELLISLKQAFDPAGVFNPGRLYSWL
jgi:glycolate oxidase FAD binding subunit